MSSKPHQHFEAQSYLRLLRYAKPYRGRLLIGIIAGFLAGGSIFSSFFWIKDLVSPFEKKPASTAVAGDVATESDGGGDKNIREMKKFADRFDIPVADERGRMTWQFFALSGTGFILLFVFKNLFTYVNRFFMRWVGTRVVADLRDQVFHKLMNQSLKFYGKHDVGQLISRCTQDTAALESAVSNVIADLTRCPWEIIGSVGFIIYSSVNTGNYALPIILFVGMPLTVLPIILIGRKIRKTYRRAFHNIASVISKMHEVFTGIKVVKSHRMEDAETKHFKGLNLDYFNTVISALKTELLMQPLMESVAVLASAVFLVYCFSQQVMLSDIVVLTVPAFLAYRPIKSLAKVNNYIQRSMAAADRYFNLIDMPVEVRERENPVVLDTFEREIRLDHVDFSYDGDNRVLADIDIVIPRGSVLAVVGQTGSGKTTIANLIARFYDPTSGTVSVDGVDLRDMSLDSLRSLIGIVSQETILFNDTVAANIAYGLPDVPRERIVEAAKRANAHQFITDGRHPEGYDTVVGEKGFKLSGGEKQRVAIARAILKNPPILILDEATSALDTVTERLVQQALDRVMANRTVFAIAHRLSTIKHSDSILVLDRGRIIERGTHGELMRQGGVYKNLHDIQFGMDHG